MRSLRPSRVSISSVSGVTSPLITLIHDSRPEYWSRLVLNTNAAGAPSPSRPSFAAAGGATASSTSSRLATPEFRVADPATTGTTRLPRSDAASPVRTSSSLRVSSSRYFSISSSLPSAAPSIRPCRYSSTVSARSSGTVPGDSWPPMWVSALPLSRSTTPENPAPSPIGTTAGTKLPGSFSRKSASVLAKLACSLSIWFTNTMHGLPSACSRRHSLAVSICTPTSPPTTITATSLTCRAATTSPMKSADPGVSSRLILAPFHGK